MVIEVWLYDLINDPLSCIMPFGLHDFHLFLFFFFIYYICHFTINLDLIIKVKIRNMARKPKRNQGGLYEARFPHKSEIIKYTNIAEQSVQLGVTRE